MSRSLREGVRFAGADRAKLRRFVDRALVVEATWIAVDFEWPDPDDLNVRLPRALRLAQLSHLRASLMSNGDDLAYWPLTDEMLDVVRARAREIADDDEWQDPDPLSESRAAVSEDGAAAREALAVLDRLDAERLAA